MGNQQPSYDTLPKQDGKVAIVTGAAGGIGFVTAQELARKGAHVILLGRNKPKTEEAAARIRAETKNEHVEAEECDLSSFASVNAFSDRFLAKNVPINILVNNAGIMATPFELSKDGIEMQMATNHFGHFLLTQRLLPAIARGQPSRIVNVSSSAHAFAYSDGIHTEQLNDEKAYSPWARYGETKLANIFFTKELQRRLAAKGFNQIWVNCCHPGAIATDLQTRAAYSWLLTIVRPFFLTPQNGGFTQTYLATSPEVEAKDFRGQFFVPYAKHEQPSAAAQNDEYAARVYEWSERIVTEKLGDAYKSFV